MPRKKKSNAVRAFRLFNSWFGNKIDEHTTPEMQLRQAQERAQADHVKLTQDAAQIMGAAKKMHLDRDRAEGDAKQKEKEIAAGLIMLDRAIKSGDNITATQLQDSLPILAAEMESDRARVQQFDNMLPSADKAAEEAKALVDENRRMLAQVAADSRVLQAQASQARMSNVIATSIANLNNGISDDPNMPNLSEIRDRIETDFANAAARAELASAGSGAVSRRMRQAALTMAGEESLTRIRGELAAQGKIAAIEAPKADKAAIETGKTDDAKVVDMEKAGATA